MRAHTTVSKTLIIMVFSGMLLLLCSCDSRDSSKSQAWRDFYPGAENLNQAGLSYVPTGQT